MGKTIIKESLIILLLCIIIALILAVIFYDYIPTNKIIPEQVSYSMPAELSEVQEELSNTFNTDNEKVILTYEITEEDLTGYKQTKIYEAGKANPFDVYKEETTSTKEENSNNSQQEEQKLKEPSTNKTNSTGTIFETGNTK